MNFKNVDKKYRPVPFWSWNEKLSPEETRRQTAIMDESGHGGYFMHARGGLQTEYMGDEWFENVSAAIDESNKRGMHAWAYDENGWPSGFGSGKVNGKGEKYWQKYLRIRPADADMSDIEPHRVITKNENYIFYYDVNPFYVDTLDGEVIADFINEIYLPYYEKYGNTFDGFFTDEPQISRNGIPWSLTMLDEYKKAWGEDLSASLASLFLPVGDFEDVRIKFWKLCTDLFSKNFMKQIYDWCVERGLGLTGHLVLEENLTIQITSNGACMPHYEYFTIPGMDWLGRPINPCLTPVQVASVAAQTGKKQVLSETFALCGHNVGHEELKRNYEWMMVRGINLMCQHLLGYSLRGIRKRDYPPAMYYQQPWWDEYKVFNDAMSRVGMILAEGRITVNTLLMHNMTSAWICYNNGESSATRANAITPDFVINGGASGINTYKDMDIRYFNTSLVGAATELERKHIPFHFGDETIMERHGRVEGNKLIIGEMEYTTVVLPNYIRFMPNTQKLLDEFKANCGIITTPDQLAPADIIDNPEITFAEREFDDFKAYYFVNSTNKDQKAKISRGSYAIDITTGDKVEFTGEYTFPEYGSLLVIDDGTPCAAPAAAKELKTLDLGGDWTISNQTFNSLTLDKCTYWFDGELQEENAYVLDIVPKACDLMRPVDVYCEFKANIEDIPENLYLACETPEIFEIRVNGTLIDKTDCGYFRDSAFRMIDIKKYAEYGENKIEMSVRLEQSAETYENIKKAAIFESEKNKLVYDMEIESVYLVGDFAVRCNGDIVEADKGAAFFADDFTIVAPHDRITLSCIERQGYPFFSGSITLKKSFELDSTDYKLAFNKQGINAVKIKVNGNDVRTVLWAPYETDISEYLSVGENEIEITLINNLRNLLGPHHLGEGESYFVSPSSFYRRACVWNSFGENKAFREEYSLVKTGLI